MEKKCTRVPATSVDNTAQEISLEPLSEVRKVAGTVLGCDVRSRICSPHLQAKLHFGAGAAHSRGITISTDKLWERERVAVAEASHKARVYASERLRE